MNISFLSPNANIFTKTFLLSLVSPDTKNQEMETSELFKIIFIFKSVLLEILMFL